MAASIASCRCVLPHNVGCAGAVSGWSTRFVTMKSPYPGLSFLCTLGAVLPVQLALSSCCPGFSGVPIFLLCRSDGQNEIMLLDVQRVLCLLTRPGRSHPAAPGDRRR